MNPSLPLSRRLLYCLISAALVCFSFPSFLEKTLEPSTAFLGWFALVPFFMALRGVPPRRAAFLGFVFGFVQFGGVLYWIAILQAAEYLSGLGWAALVLYLSLYPMLFAFLYSWLSKRVKLSNIWFTPFLWVGTEYLRGSRPWGGFNWAELGYSQAPYPVILVCTTLAGVYGLTFLMVWVNVLLTKFFEPKVLVPDDYNASKEGWPRWAYLVLPLVLVGLVLVWGNVVVHNTQLKKAGTVALLQPSIDQAVKWSKANETATYDKLEKMTAEAQEGHPDLIVWPETAAPDYLLLVPHALERVRTIVIQSKTFNLVGCLDAVRMMNASNDIRYFNAAAHFSPTGVALGVYHKRHLVPFGEFVPFQKYLTFLGPVVGNLGDFDRGDRYENFKTATFSYTPMICYEAVFPDDARQALGTGADALVNISNDAWFGWTASPYQHAMMAVVRAAENRKPLLRSANTGITLITDPFGRVLDSTRIYEDKVLKGDVWVFDGKPTPYARFGNWLPRLCLIVLALLIVAAFLKKGQESAEPIIESSSIEPQGPENVV